jgi:TPP-dependent pyruvate/acetoin dehydrogenase alpha subunit
MSEISTALISGFYRKMYLIRAFETKILDLFSAGELTGTTHTCLGQEANAVGIISQLLENDIIFSNHRCHGHYLARFDDPKRLMAELMGKETGVCGGIGGSQHIHGTNFYTNGVQGGIVPVCAGMALAQKIKKDHSIAVVFIGDGTLGQGVVYETLNIASLWSLPLLIVVEDNCYAQFTPTTLEQSGSLVKRAAGFGIDSSEMQTTDVIDLFSEAERIIQFVRENCRPFWWVIHTYRLGPHSKGDDLRDPQEIEAHRKIDPIVLLKDRLSRDLIVGIEKECDARIQEAIEFSHSSKTMDREKFFRMVSQVNYGSLQDGIK